MANSPNVNQPRNLTLEDAWQRFAKYDKNAGVAQKRFIFQRKLILGLGVAASAIAISYSELEQLIDSSEEQRAELPGWMVWLYGQLTPYADGFLPWMHLFVILIPIVISILVAGTVKFNMGISWVMLRSAAEALKKEIFRYRTQIDEYRAVPNQIDSRDVELARKLKLISKRLMETQVNQTGLEGYDAELPPPRGAAEGDDGFSDLTPEQYLQYRLEDQFGYYQRKAIQRSNELRRFQWLIYILGGVGTLLAAVGFDVWIAVVGAVATALASFLEFKRVESTIVSFNMAAADLYDIRTWWRALSDAARAHQTNIETLVNSTELVIQTENAGWLQEMRDALSEIYGKEQQEDRGSESLPPIEPAPDFPASLPDASTDLSIDPPPNGDTDSYPPAAETTPQSSPI